MKDIRIAVVTCNSPVNNTENNLESMTRWVKISKKEDAAIVCFPEMNVTGYSNHIDIKSVAEPIPGPSTQYILSLAEAEKIVILAGIAERDAKNRIFAFIESCTSHRRNGTYSHRAAMFRCLKPTVSSLEFSFVMTPISPNYPHIWP